MIDILVPVLGRPHQVEPLVNSIASTTDVPYRLLFLCSKGDTAQIEAVKKAGVKYLLFEGPPANGQYAKKINLGFRKTDNPWLFLCADDVRFRPGWATTAFKYGGNAAVIGTNDLANYFVRQGLLATHPLIRREYVLDPGASLDGPGIIYHEGYSHNFVDCELSVLARQRGVFAFAKTSIVEHMHPAFGRAETDETYQYGFRDFDADRALFCRRMAGHVRDPLARRFIAADHQMARGRHRRSRR